MAALQITRLDTSWARAAGPTCPVASTCWRSLGVQFEACMWFFFFLFVCLARFVSSLARVHVHGSYP